MKCNRRKKLRVAAADIKEQPGDQRIVSIPDATALILITQASILEMMEEVLREQRHMKDHLKKTRKKQ